jgi:hypothetical protein
MNDRPTAIELLHAVRGFLEKDVIPALEGPKQFHARVAANLMSILAREWELEEDHLRAERQRLVELLAPDTAEPETRSALRADVRRLTETLCKRIRAGDADHGPWRAAVLAHVRQTVADKLAVNDPGMLAREAGRG